jgi:hypothetical protein
MGRSALRVMGPGFVKTQLAVHGQAHLRGVRVFLAIVFPPANRAQSHCIRRFQRFVSAARTAEPSCDSLHVWMDDKNQAGFTVT